MTQTTPTKEQTVATLRDVANEKGWPQCDLLREAADLIETLAAQLAEADGWRPIKTQPPTKADGLFLVFVPSCIMGCALVENGKIVWPREGESEQAHGVTHWRPLPAPPSAREG